MNLRTIIVSAWIKKEEKDSFINNELSTMGPGEIPDGE